ncbi:MAG TPA: AI-2E family transporter [Nitrospiraceae bacterium]|nr:AI-2E family transporter [Nitrospiraceae bacterium]
MASTDPLAHRRASETDADMAPLARLIDGLPHPHSVALTGLFILGVLYTLHLGRVVFIPIAIAVMLSVLLAPVIRRMKKIKIPEPIGAAVLLSVGVFVVAYGLSRLAEPAAEWIAKAPDALSAAEYKLRVLKKPMQEMSKASDLISKATNPDESKKVQQVEVRGNAWPLKVFSITGEFLAGLAAMLVLLFFFLSSGDLFLQKIMKVLHRLQDKKRAVEIIREIEGQLATYLFTVTCINFGLGVAVGSAMFLLGMPNPVLWGTMAAFLTFIPYLGHMVGVAVVSLVAAMTFESVGWIFAVGGAYSSLAIIEGSFAYPMILGHRLELNPVVLLIGLMVWGWIWGIPGALLAVPLMVAFKILCEHIEALAPVGEFMGR